MKLLQLIIIYALVFGSFVACADEEKWQEHKASHFIIYYQEAPVNFIEDVESTAEDYYHEIARNLGFTRYKNWTWDERAKIYIFNDQEHYLASGRAAGWSGGHANPRSKIIRTFPSAAGFFDTTLPHELGHIVFREFIGNNAQVPLWFEEGVAMYQEKAKRWGAHQAVRKLLKSGHFISLPDLDRTVLTVNASQELVDLYYLESASVVNFIIDELGETRFLQFCRKLKEGASFLKALKTVYVRFNNLEDLNKAWVSFLEG